MLSDHCLSVCPVCLSVCNVGVLWQNDWMYQDATWYRHRHQPRLHCVRWGPSSPRNGAQQPPNMVWGLRTQAGLSIMFVYCGQVVGWIKMPLGKEVGLFQATLCIYVRWRPSSPPRKGAPNTVWGLRAQAGQPASVNRGPCLLWQNGLPSQQLLSSCCSLLVEFCAMSAIF